MKPSIVLRHPDKTNCSLILEKNGEEGEERGEIEGVGGGGGKGEIPAITNAHHKTYISCLPITVSLPPPKKEHLHNNPICSVAYHIGQISCKFS